MPIQCLSANSSDIDTFACPCHGWEAIQNYIYTTVNSLQPKYLASIGAVSGPSWVEVTGHGSQRRLALSVEYYEADGTNSGPSLVMATTQQSTIADALTETGNLWVDAVSNVSTSGHGNILQRQDAAHAINNDYYQPYTVSVCANDTIRGPHDDSAVAFPIPPAAPVSMLDQSKINDSILGIQSFVYPGITKDQILDTPGSLEESRLKWVELPQDPFNGSAIGAVVLLPRSTANSTQELLVCNLGGGWGSSSSTRRHMQAVQPLRRVLLTHP